MLASATPTLEDLRHSAQAAWLWDISRSRLVWANPAGTQALGAASLFDLIDRPFDPSEPALSAMAGLLRHDSDSVAENLDLAFPSLGEHTHLTCHCRRHVLADGRTGILAIAKPVEVVVPVTLPIQADVSLHNHFNDLPVAACVLDAKGIVLSRNGQAQALFGFELGQDLNHVILPEGQLENLLQRLKASSLVSEISSYVSPYGTREARFTLRRSGESNGDVYAIMVAEDVTDRRILERQINLNMPVVESLDTSEQKVFEEIGRALNGEHEAATVVAETIVEPTPVMVAQLEDRPQQEIPQPILDTLNKSQDAIAIIQGREPVFVSTGLATLLGHSDVAGLQNDKEFWLGLAMAAPEVETLRLPKAGGEFVELKRQINDIPWHNGKAEQLTLSALPVADMPLVEEATPIVVEFQENLPLDVPAAVAPESVVESSSGVVESEAETLVSLEASAPDVETLIEPVVEVTSLAEVVPHKAIEAELIEAREVAEKASRNKSEFLAHVSHEIRTPLNAIIGFSEILRLKQNSEMLTDKHRGYLNDIHASASYVLALVNDLLDLSKIESGKMELNFTAVSLGECYDYAARILADQSTRSGVVMRKAIPDNLPRIVADLKSMRQIILNVLSNAVKFTDHGGQVIVSAASTPNGSLVLRLQDTGLGMDSVALEQALEPFTRINTPGRERQGTGLGLPLTKALVEANRASFTISSDKGQGTLVEITFPTTRVLAE